MLSEAEVATRLRSAGCVFAEAEAALLCGRDVPPGRRDALVARRASGEPLEHVLGWSQFAGIRVAVAPGCFIPRRRSEFLLDRARAHTRPGAVVLDLCCGCGALGAALAASVADVTVHATDIEPRAVACARANLAAAGGHVYRGDLFAPLPGALAATLDVIVANVPYVPTAEIATMPAEARLHEPRRALDGGADGLDVLRRVAAEAPHWLAPGAAVLSEVAGHQLDAAGAALAAAGLDPRTAGPDEFGSAVVIGVRPGGGHRPH